MFVRAQNNSKFSRSILPCVIDIVVPASRRPLRSISQPKPSRTFTSQNLQNSSERSLLGTSPCPQKLPARERAQMSCAPHRLLSTQSTINKNTQNEVLCVESMNTGEPIIHACFEKNTGTWQYIVADAVSSSAVIIDPVLDYDRTTQTITTQSADSILKIIEQQSYNITLILETHVHADHITAASYLQSKLAKGGQGVKPSIGIGKRITQIQNLFGQRYGVPEAEYQNAFGKLLDDDEKFQIGELAATAIHLPGHTPDHLGYQVGSKFFGITLKKYLPADYFGVIFFIKTTCFVATLFSMQISEQHDVISPVGVLASSSSPGKDCWDFLINSRSGQAMTIPLQGVRCRGHG